MSQYERIPPHNDDAEKSVLGSILLDKEDFMKCWKFSSQKIFYSEIHMRFTPCIIELYRKSQPIDILTVSEELKKRKTLEMVGGRAYVALLSSVVPSTSNVGGYAKIIAEKAVLRKLINASSNIIENAYQEKMESAEVLDYSERVIFEIAQSRQNKDYQAIKDVLWNNITMIDEMSKLEGNITGLTTGFIDLDAKLRECKDQTNRPCSKTQYGKTAFALNIAQQAAIKGKAKVLIFSLEMSQEQLGQRMLSMESRIEIQKLKTGNLERQDWDQIHIALDTLSKTSIYIDDTPGITPMEIKNKCRRLKAEKGLDLVVIDYLQLMTFEGKTENRQQEITAISRYLKQLAREMDCPVLVLSQLSRAPEQRADHRPILSDLRESGSIEQDADIVMFLYRMSTIFLILPKNLTYVR